MSFKGKAIYNPTGKAAEYASKMSNTLLMYLLRRWKRISTNSRSMGCSFHLPLILCYLKRWIFI